MSTSSSDREDTSVAPKVWFITGTSAGLGRLLVKDVVARGDYVIASARKVEDIKDLEIGSGDAGSSESNGQCRAICLDVSSPFESIRRTIAEAVQFWGRIDVLVHNAGNAMLGISEESGVEGYQTQFATNFFGPMNITHAVLPYMRAARSGTIVFVGSRSIWKANVLMLGPYASSKAALSAAAQALAVEVAPFGIRILEICPGSMRTRNFEKLILLPAVSVKTQDMEGISKAIEDDAGEGEGDGDGEGEEAYRIADYAPYRTAQVEFLRTLNGTQPGDPVRVAKVIVDLVRVEGVFEGCDVEVKSVKTATKSNPWAVAAKETSGPRNESEEEPQNKMLPSALVLGSDAQRDVRQKCTQVLRGVEQWEGVGRSIDFAPHEG